MKPLLAIWLSCALLGPSTLIGLHTESPPSIYFLHNTAAPRVDSAWYQQQEEVNSLDDAISTIVTALEEDPHLVVVAIGHCDYLEKDRNALALARANAVRELLVSRGVPEDQVRAEGRVDQYRITKGRIDAMQTMAEKDMAHAMNRFVNYTTGSFDRKP